MILLLDATNSKFKLLHHLGNVSLKIKAKPIQDSETKSIKRKKKIKETAIM